MRRIPSLNWLRVFEAAARTGSFARAAEALNMSPPAISQQIKALEGYLGQNLFDRGARSVTLTEAGHAFLPAVARSLHTVERTAESLFGRPGLHLLSIRCSAVFLSGWLIPRLGRFRSAHPDVQLTLSTEVLAEDPVPTSTDLRISFGLPSDIRGEADPLFGERIYPVALPAIAAAVTSPEDLAANPLIEISTHRANWSALLPASGPEPRFIYCDTTMAALALAAAGEGIALARAPASHHLETVYSLIPCLPGLEVTGTHSYFLSFPAQSGLSDAARAFRGWLLREAKSA
ncbi:MAG: LysR family transcriptional regulator [Pseudomonadota bacterium]